MQISDDSFYSLERFITARTQGEQTYLKLTTKESQRVAVNSNVNVATF